MTYVTAVAGEFQSILQLPKWNITWTLILTFFSFYNERIAGGIGAVLPWIPIKAYRPCPNFIESGGRYTRTGQPLDEIAFGKGNLNQNIDIDDGDFWVQDTVMLLSNII